MIIVCTCSVKINSVCITIPKTAPTDNPFQIYHQYDNQYFLHSHHLRQYNHHRQHQHGQLDMVITWKCSVASRWVVCVRGRDGSLRGSSSGETSASTTSSVKKDFEERFWIWLDDILWNTVGKVKKQHIPERSWQNSALWCLGSPLLVSRGNIGGGS